MTAATPTRPRGGRRLGQVEAEVGQQPGRWALMQVETNHAQAKRTASWTIGRSQRTSPCGSCALQADPGCGDRPTADERQAEQELDARPDEAGAAPAELVGEPGGQRPARGRAQAADQGHAGDRPPRRVAIELDQDREGRRRQAERLASPIAAIGDGQPQTVAARTRCSTRPRARTACEASRTGLPPCAVDPPGDRAATKAGTARDSETVAKTKVVPRGPGRAPMASPEHPHQVEAAGEGHDLAEAEPRTMTA